MTDIRTALEAFLRPWDSMSDEYLRSGAAAVEFGIETVGRVIAARAAISAASPEPERCACGEKSDSLRHMHHDQNDEGTHWCYDAGCHPFQPAPTPPSAETLRDEVDGFMQWFIASYGIGRGSDEALRRLHRIVAARADERTRLDAPLTVEALAKEFIHIRGAHKGDYDSGEALGVPCEWCVLAAEQAVQAVAALAEQGR